MTPVRFQQPIGFGREQRGVEFKSPGAFTDVPLNARVIRAMLVMSNTPDGGAIVVGVNESEQDAAI